MPRKNESTRIPGKQTRVLRRTLAIAGGAQHQISPPCLCSVMPRKNESTRIPGKQTRVLRRTLAIAGGAQHQISPPCLCSVMPRKNESTRIPGKQTRVLRRTLAIAGEHNIKYLHRVCAQLCQEGMSQLVFQLSRHGHVQSWPFWQRWLIIAVRLRVGACALLVPAGPRCSELGTLALRHSRLEFTDCSRSCA
ncbi:hypothetical protein J6590_057361 [Homalodisca vitripennis]|nr:hypothetical protein J6590_057361 [Homalodisca vitripennis]